MEAVQLRPTLQEFEEAIEELFIELVAEAIEEEEEDDHARRRPTRPAARSRKVRTPAKARA